jgi:hypothetical protein
VRADRVTVVTEFELTSEMVGPRTRATGAELTRRDPKRVWATLVESARYQALYDPYHVDVRIHCRHGHHVLTIWAYTGSEEASRLPGHPDRALWIAHRTVNQFKVERMGLPARSLRVRHLCQPGRPEAVMRVDVDRVREHIEEIWGVGRVTRKDVIW